MTTTRPSPAASAVDPQTFSLDDKYRVEEGTVLLTGVQALVRLVFDQVRADRRGGLRTAAFVSGYPGSPLGGFDLALQRTGRYLAEHDVTWVPGVNEDLAATAVWGSQQDHLAPLAHHDGVVGMWYGKAPGVDRCGDVFRHANLHGVGRNGGVVCAAGDDPTSKSSTLPSASEIAFYDAMIPVLVPGSPGEILDLGRHAFEISRFSGCWTALKIVTSVADGLGMAEVGPWRLQTSHPTLEFDGRPWRHVQQRRLFVPESLEMERDLAYRRHEAAKAYATANGVNRITVDPADAWLGIIAAGRTYFEVRDALAQLGLDDRELVRLGVRLLKLGMVYPLEERAVETLARGVDEVLVIEEKRSFVEQFVREILYARSGAPRLVGKRDERREVLVPADGELTADRLVPVLAARLGTRLDLPRPAGAPPGPNRSAPVAVSLGPIRGASDPPPARTAHFCSGCPHNRSTIDVSGSPVGGGVGCHAMVLWMDRGVTSYTHMGGEGAQWIGRSHFTDTPHMVQNMGDGTFFHSGSMVVRAAVASGVNITFKILYNGVVAMTGGQDPTGQMTVPQLCRFLEIEGVQRIIVCSEEPGRYRHRDNRLPRSVTLWDRDRLEDAERELAGTDGVTVLVYDQGCAAEMRRLRKRGRLPERTTRVVINERVCEGCGDCGAKSSCLSVHPVETEFGRKTRIHQSSCNTDYSCLEGDCPSFVTVRAPAPGRRARRSGDGPAGLPAPPPPPLAPIGPDGFNLYMAGVGGTGVVTVNQVVATAAALDGLSVTGLDQTGLSQKGGPVVSHLRLAAAPVETSNAVGPGAADCLLALDLLVALDGKNLVRADPARTAIAASSSVVPTAQMVIDSSVAYPAPATLMPALEEASRPGAFVHLDALRVAEELCGDHMVANMVVLGAALQAGFLPLQPASIQRAVELNGVAVERNMRALAAGRLAVADPARLAKALDRGAARHQRVSRRDGRAADRAGALLAGTRLEGELARVVLRRAAELIDYQGERLARRYVEVVLSAADAERETGTGSTRLSETVATTLFALTAYKDEYEVARLHLRPELRDAVASAVPGATGVRFRLHPPLLRSLGMRSKIAIPAPVAVPMFAVLRSMRGVRGTPLDPFGHSRVRRLERSLVEEYTELVRGLARDLTPERLDASIELAGLASMVRGYETIKEANAAAYRRALAERLAALDAAIPAR
ncbi:MAG: indolepyruvate ferredoxin oxidoreductase family protein [Actinomycetota bacterium]|nr:indolepyruvate ferredoxin oxidoreductase family protein [Actinomycetota bacterium]